MTQLPDKESSRAILLGCEKFESPDLADLPAIGRNLTDLQALLTNPDTGAFDKHHTGILRAKDCAGVRSVYQALRSAATAATDTFLVYYAGHGLTSMRRNELYLCLADTAPDALSVSGLSVDQIREVFLDCPARNRILILDCCFSGRATSDYMATTSDLLAGQSEITGTYTLASAPPTAASLAPPGERYTAFTGALLDMLRDGEPSGPELLTLDVLYGGLRRRMNARGFPLPTQRGTDLAHHLAIGRNPAYSPPTVVPAGPPVREERDSRPPPPSDPSPADPGPAIPAPAEPQTVESAQAHQATGSPQADSAEASSPSHRARGRDWLAVSGLLLMLVAGTVADIFWAVYPRYPRPLPALYVVTVYTGNAIPMIAAFAALMAGSLRRLLVPVIFGAWFINISGLVEGILAIPAYPVLSGGRSNAINYLGRLSADVLALAAGTILFFVMRRSSRRDRWAVPRIFPVLLFGGVVLSTGIWCATLTLELHSRQPGDFFSRQYPQITEFIVLFAVALCAAWLALGLDQRLAGGVLLLGQTAAQISDFLSGITGGSRFSAGVVALNWVTVLLMVATGGLAVAYIRRTKPSGKAPAARSLQNTAPRLP